MALTVAELAGMSHLRLEFAAGRAGAGATVAWGHPSDLDTPWQWLTGGELLMKNGRTLPRAATKQAAFLRRLAEAGVSGVVIGLDSETPPLAPAMLAAADALPLPLLLAPYSAGFAAIGRAVADANMGEEASRIALTERVYEAVRQSVAHQSSHRAFRQLSRDLACRLAVLDADTGDVALENTPALPEGLRAALATEVRARQGRIPGVLHLQCADRHGVAVEVPDAEPTVLVAYDFRTRTPDIGLLQHLATAAAVLLAQQGLRREHDRRVGGELLGHLLDRRLDEEQAVAALETRQLLIAEAVLVAAIGGSAEGQQRLHLSLARRAVPHLVLRRADVLYVLVPPSPDALATIRRRLGDEALIGVSDPVGHPDRAPSARREATWAARVAATTPERTSRYRDATLLSVQRDTEEAQVVVDRVLADLIAHDAAHNSRLLATLDAFLTLQRSWQRTAAQLGVHRQTVVYRIRRVEDITGRNLSQTSDIAELWLALRARELVGTTDEG